MLGLKLNHVSKRGHWSTLYEIVESLIVDIVQISVYDIRMICEMLYKPYYR